MSEAGEVYGSQDSAVTTGVETASERSPEKRPELFDNRYTLPEGTVAGPFPRALFCFPRS